MDSGFNIPAPPIPRYQFRDNAVSYTSARLDVRVQACTHEQSWREVLGSPIYGKGELVDATLPRKAPGMSWIGVRTVNRHR